MGGFEWASLKKSAPAVAGRYEERTLKGTRYFVVKYPCRILVEGRILFNVYRRRRKRSDIEHSCE
jgi:hypothetical protein